MMIDRQDLTGVFFAALLSIGSITVLCYAITGSNSAVTAVLLITFLAAVPALSFRGGIAIGVSDLLFALFLLSVAASFALNGQTADPKEWEIFATSIAAYPACRFLSLSEFEKGRRAFILTTVGIVAVATILTAIALVAQWDDIHGKPIVGGYGAASTVFLGSFGFLLIAIASTRLTMRKTLILSSVIFITIFVYAASLSRFTFIALIGSLGIAAFLNRAEQRKCIAVIMVVIVAGIVAGNVARSRHASVLWTFATAATPERPASGSSKISPPSCSLDVDMNNSIAERKALLRDGLYLLPLAGAFGFGLDGFMKYSCLTAFSLHNSALQAFVEFGWIGGAALSLLVILSLVRLLQMARRGTDVRFVVCGLAYIAAISLAHGRTSRDILLFAMLGLATASVAPSATSTIPELPPRPTGSPVRS
jgi:O-antigen ligase